MTTMAAVDRLVHHATILEFTGESIRANAAKKRQVKQRNNGLDRYRQYNHSSGLMIMRFRKLALVALVVASIACPSLLLLTCYRMHIAGTEAEWITLAGFGVPQIVVLSFFNDFLSGPVKSKIAYAALYIACSFVTAGMVVVVVAYMAHPGS